MLRALITVAGQVLVLAVCTPILLIAGAFGRSQRLFAFWALVWSRSILWLAGVRLTVSGVEPVTGTPCFFVGNHLGALDIPVLFVALRGHVRFMAKDSLFRIPLFGWTLSRYGFVRIDRARPRVAFRALQRMLQNLQSHPISFAVFPEGTRSADGKLLPFRRGALKICRDSGLPIVPFSIEGTNAVYVRGRVRITPGPVRITFGTPIPADEVASLSAQELLERVRGEVERQLGHRTDGPADAAEPVRLRALATEGV